MTVFNTLRRTTLVAAIALAVPAFAQTVKLTLGHGDHPAEALQGQHRKRHEQVPQRAWLRQLAAACRWRGGIRHTRPPPGSPARPVDRRVSTSWFFR